MRFILLFALIGLSTGCVMYPPVMTGIQTPPQIVYYQPAPVYLPAPVIVNVNVQNYLLPAEPPIYVRPPNYYRPAQPYCQTPNRYYDGQRRYCRPPRR